MTITVPVGPSRPDDENASRLLAAGGHPLAELRADVLDPV